MPKNLNPLLPEQRPKWRKAAREGRPLEELVGLTMPDTGLRRSAMAHLNERWLRLEAENPHIIVKAKDECTLGFEERGRQSTAGVPCKMCREERGGKWGPKTLPGRRRVWVNEEETQEILEAWFNLNDRVCSESNINRVVDTIAGRADLDREVTPQHLRQTYGTKLAEREHTAHEIKKLMGHNDIRQSQDYVDLYGPALGENHTEKWHQHA